MAPIDKEFKKETNEENRLDLGGKRDSPQGNDKAICLSVCRREVDGGAFRGDCIGGGILSKQQKGTCE